MFNNITELESFIGRMIDKLDSARTDTLELDTGSVRIKLGRGGYKAADPAPACEYTSQIHAPMPAEASATEPSCDSAASVLHAVTAPLIGVAYGASSPDSAPFIKVGDIIKKGDIICIIEAMKVMNEIESDCDGEVAEILFENGKMVEFGQPLVRLK